MTERADRPILGWREWLALPDLGIGAIKAKIDTGARTSSLAVAGLETFEEHGELRVRFRVRPRRRSNRSVLCSARIADRRVVTDSGAHAAERWFIRTRIDLGGAAFEVDINLTDRRDMLFPMLIGRTALDGRFVVDPSLSYTFARPSPMRPTS